MPRINVKDKRKQQLMEANIISIARRGLTETTIAHVSKGAGMSRGIVNFYFTSKEKMMQETLLFMVEDVNTAWQETLAAGRSKNADPIAIIESILRVLMGDKLCSNKRMAVWAAFLGLAGTHHTSSKVIRAMDDGLTQQLRKLWQEAGYETKAAEANAVQLIALIRGHWLISALSENEKRPSHFIEGWIELLQGTLPSSGKVVKLKPAASRKKKPHSDTLPGQLDMGDLFSR